MQTQTSNSLYNAIMEAGSKDRPPMLAPGNYIQWKSRIKRYIDTKPNRELIHYCLENPPYELGWNNKPVLDSEGNPSTVTARVFETYKNVEQKIRDQLNAEAEAVQIILTGIDNDIYSTVDACPNACEMWKAIERLKQDNMVDLVAGGLTRYKEIYGILMNGFVSDGSDVEEVKEKEIVLARKEYTVDVYMPDIFNGVYGSDEFRMIHLRIVGLAPATSPTPAPVKAVKSNCVTCGGTHSYQNCPATSRNVYQDNIHEYVSQAAAANYNQGNTGFCPQMVANQIRPPGFPPVNQVPAYQAPIPQTQSVSQTDFERYVKANDAVLRNIQSQGQSTQTQCQNIQNQYQTVQNQLANLTDMMSKFMSSDMASSSGSGTLPGNKVTNLKEDLKGNTTRSGVAYKGPTIPTPSKVVKQGTEVTKDQVQTLSSQSTAHV
nr:zinc finger CCCH domain-containing protein 29-like [Tanacetum cinerariifolium]